MNITQFAQAAESGCTINGQPVDCSEVIDKAKPFLAWGIGVVAVITIISIAIFVFWLLMLVHTLQHDSPDKETWIIVLAVSFVLGFGLIGALVYYFAEKKKADAYPHKNSN